MAKKNTKSSKNEKKAKTKVDVSKSTGKSHKEKIVKKDNSKFVEDKKTKNKKESTPKHVSQTVPKAQSNNDMWQMIAITLGIIVLILATVTAYMVLNPNCNNKEVVQNQTVKLADNLVVENLTNETKVLVVYAPDYEKFSNIDLFLDGFKKELLPDLKIEKIDEKSTEGKSILDSLHLKLVPIYLFNQNIEKLKDWETGLKQYFIEVPTKIRGQKYYLFNPAYVQNQVLSEPIKIPKDAVVMGNSDAPVTLFEFTDFKCPYCGISEGNAQKVELFKRYKNISDYIPTMPKVYENYVDTGKVKIVFINYALHHNASTIHEAALCANEQGKFREYSHLIWHEANETALNDTNMVVTLKGYAKELSLNLGQFNDCFDSDKYAQQINDDIALGQQYGVQGTPGFFVDQKFVSGAQDYRAIKEVIDSELAK